MSAARRRARSVGSERAAPAGAAAGTRAGLVLAAAGSMLVFSTGLAEVYGLPKLMVLACGTAIAWGFLAAGRGARLRATGLGFPLAGMTAAYLVSLFFSGDRFVGIVGSYGFYGYGLIALLLCIAALYAAAYSGEPELPHFVLSATLWAGAAVGLYALLQKAGMEPFAGTRPLPGGRAVSTMGDPVFLGACLLMPVPAAVHFSMSRAGGRRAQGIAAGALIAAGLLCSFSRGSWLGAAAAAAAYLLLSGRLRPARWSAAARAGAAAACVIGAVAMLAAAVCFRPVARSDSARWELWVSMGRVIGENPWFGTGPDTVQTALRKHRTEGFIRALKGTFRSQVAAHNDFLQAWATTGILGLAAYLWLLAAAARLIMAGLRDESRRDTAAVVGAALLGLFVHAKFNPVPLTGMALAAIYAGLLAHGESRAEGVGRRAGRALVFLFCVVCAAGAARLIAADRAFAKAKLLVQRVSLAAAADSYRKAVRLNPYEPYYRMSLARFLYSLSRRVKGSGRRTKLITEAVGLGRAAMSLRPAVPEGYLIYGTYLMVLKIDGGPDRLDEAESAFARAAGMDPYFLPLIENRMKLAALRGNAADERKFRKKFAKLSELGGGR